MKFTLTEPKEKLDEIIALGLLAFDSVTKDEVVQHIESADSVVLAEENSLIGFALNEHFEDLLYFSGSCVHPAAQGKNVYSLMRRKSLDLPHSKVVTRTQNPRIFCGLRRILSNVELVSYSDTRILELMNMELDQDNIAQGFYGKSLYSSKPLCANKQVQALFDKLNYGRWRCIFACGVF